MMFSLPPTSPNHPLSGAARPYASSPGDLHGAGPSIRTPSEPASQVGVHGYPLLRQAAGGRGSSETSSRGGGGTPYLVIDHVSKTLRARRREESDLEVLRELSLQADLGEFVSVIGPSGCGKSTLLNIVAGLDAPTAGSVCLQGDAAARRLGVVAYMHQRDLLLPWRSVIDNAALSLEVRGVAKRESRDRARAVLAPFGLSGFENAFPAELSGGMRQRVALLRSMLPERDVLLLDEPFGALDAITRSSMHEWLGGVLQDRPRAVVLVTHDVEEAILLSDRVHVLSARPSVVLRQFDVDLPRPRTRALLAHQRFMDLKAAMLGVLFNGEDPAV